MLFGCGSAMAAVVVAILIVKACAIAEKSRPQVSYPHQPGRIPDAFLITQRWTNDGRAYEEESLVRFKPISNSVVTIKPFIQGMLSAFVLFPRRKSVDELTAELESIRRGNSIDQDIDALRSDWEKVGDDMRTAIRRIEKGY